MPDAGLTYKTVITEMTKHCRLNNKSEAAIANLLSALKAFMAQFGLTEDVQIGTTFRASHSKLLAQHVDQLVAEERPAAYIRNRKTALKAWKKLVNELDFAYSASNHLESPFQKELRRLMALGSTQATVAKQAGISLATFKRWLSGTRPNFRAIPSVRRLENFFGLPADTLLDLVPTLKNSAKTTTVGEPPEIEFRKRQKVAQKNQYLLKEFTLDLRRQWIEYLRYKTSIVAGAIPRQRKGRWTVSEGKGKTETPRLWAEYLNGANIPTAGVHWSQIVQYLGWLTLPVKDGGCAKSVEEVQTLAWLVSPEHTTEFIEWRKAASGNKYHGGLIHFMKMLRAVTHPETGYLRHKPRLLETLPEELQFNWKHLCDETNRISKETLMAIEDDGSEKPSRNSFEPIAAVLSLKNPLEAVADMIHRMKVNRPLTGGEAEAVWARDILLIKILASNPLRAKNLKELEYKPDNSGSLYQREDGAWYINLDRNLFKNRRAAARERIYDMPVERSVWPDIVSYIKMYRPMIAFPGNPFFFVSSDNKSADVWKGLNRRIQALTRQYLWKCPGVGPHSFRHIVATSVLKASPNDWETVAMILHDKPETVRKFYAHLESRDGAERMFDLMQSAYKRM